MIVYVESNFVLELTLLQHEYKSCEAILDASESRSIVLVIPAFSICEPIETCVRRSNERKRLYQELTDQFRQISRSEPYRESLSQWESLRELLVRSGEEEKRALDEITQRVLNVAELIPIALSTFRAAATLQKNRSLSPQDALVCASVLDHLRSSAAGPKCFVTRDKADFLEPDIQSEFAGCDCKVLTRFCDGLGYVGSCL
jgi:predicted nucleic acid-binding protein